jgi:hypothetical protein
MTTNESTKSESLASVVGFTAALAEARSTGDFWEGMARSSMAVFVFAADLMQTGQEGAEPHGVSADYFDNGQESGWRITVAENPFGSDQGALHGVVLANTVEHALIEHLCASFDPQRSPSLVRSLEERDAHDSPPSAD